MIETFSFAELILSYLLCKLLSNAFKVFKFFLSVHNRLARWCRRRSPTYQVSGDIKITQGSLFFQLFIPQTNHILKPRWLELIFFFFANLFTCNRYKYFHVKITQSISFTLFFIITWQTYALGFYTLYIWLCNVNSPKNTCYFFFSHFSFCLNHFIWLCLRINLSQSPLVFTLAIHRNAQQKIQALWILKMDLTSFSSNSEFSYWYSRKKS